jgi:hypothetical protein
VPFSDLLSGKVEPKRASEPFLAAIRKYSGQAREHGELKPSPASADTASR